MKLYGFPALSKDTFYGLPGFLADSLPDKFGTKLIERYLLERGRDIRSGKIDAGTGYEYWLIKFDGVKNNKDKADDPAYTRIEYAYYLMDEKAGIIMNNCQLYQESGRYACSNRSIGNREI